MRKKSGFVQISNLKKIFKNDKDVGKLSKASPETMAYTIDLFLEDFLQKTINLESNSLTMENIIKEIKTNTEYDYLLPLIPKFENLAEEDISNKSKKKDKNQ